jgi:Flp pilus assembly protein TadB
MWARGVVEKLACSACVASVAAIGGGVTAVVAERWRCAVGVVATAVVVTTLLPTCQVRPTPRAGTGLSLSLLLLVRGMRGGSHGTNVHHGVDARTPRTMKPLPGAPNVTVILQYFHQHCY